MTSEAAPSRSGRAAARHAAGSGLATLGPALDADAARDGVGPRVARTVAGLPLAGAAVLLALFAIHRPWMYEVLQEDRPVEWAQFALCLACSLVALAAAWYRFRAGQAVLGVLLVLVALTCFGLAGEEISWGQRVFDLAEPATLAATNKQAELNVHNVEAGGIKVDDLFKVFSFLMGAGGAALALLTRGRRPVLAGPFWQAVSPPLFTVPGFAGMALYLPLVLVTPQAVLSPVQIFQEWVEVGLYVSLAATLACVLLRVAPAGATRRIVVPVTVGVTLLTLVFATLTIHYGVAPGNLTDLSG